eukprot:c4020_g1_i1 orf=549-851(-)
MLQGKSKGKRLLSIKGNSQKLLVSRSLPIYSSIQTIVHQFGHGSIIDHWEYLSLRFRPSLLYSNHHTIQLHLLHLAINPSFSCIWFVIEYTIATPTSSCI